MGKSRKTTYLVDTTQVVDTQTGEIATVETVKRHKISVDSEPFYMVFIDYIAPFYNLSNTTSKNVLAWMCTKAEFNTGKISLSTKDRDDIINLLGIKKSALSNALKELNEKDLIKGEKGSYIINPQIFWKGDLLTRNNLLNTKEIQVSFNISLDGTDLKEI